MSPPFVYPGDGNDPVEHYLKISSELLTQSREDEYNEAERIFINAMADLMPEDGSGLTAEENTNWDATKRGLSHGYYAASFLGRLIDKINPTHASYGDELVDKQAKQHSYAAIGLMMSQYLGLMYKPNDSDNPELTALKQRMYEDIQLLSTHDDIVSQSSPFALFQENSLNGIQQGTFSGYEASNPSGLVQAQQAIATHQKTSNQDATQLNSEFEELSNHHTKSLSEINTRISKGQLNDPTSICICLHALRLDLTNFSKTKVQSYLNDRVNASDELFQTAEDLQSNPELFDQTNPKHQQAQALLDGLTNAGELTATGDTTISGDSKPAPIIIINDDEDAPKVEINWVELKKKEADRIKQVVNNQNNELSNKLRNLSEKYYEEVNNSINAASHIQRLQGKQLQYALDNQCSTAEVGGLGGMGASLTRDKPLPSVDLLTKVIQKGYLEKDHATGKLEYHKGIQGPAWNIVFEPSDPNDLNSLNGTYTANFTKQSDVGKQQAITDQASLIALSSNSIKFTAACYREKGTGREYDKQATIEMAIMQATAIQNTSGLDLEASKIRLLMGYTKDGDEVYSDYMTIDELLALGGPKDASKDASEAKRLDINVGKYFYPDAERKIFGFNAGTKSGTNLYNAYQNAKNARAVNDAGTQFLKQTKDSDLENFAPKEPDLTKGNAAEKGAKMREHTRETVVYDQAKEITDGYKSRLQDIRDDAELDEDADAAVVGKPGTGITN